jgi:toxin YoeB
MKYRLAISQEALSDLSEQLEYRKRNEGRARAVKIKQTLNSAIRSLLDDPYRWPVYNAKLGVRVRRVNPTYSVLFSINDGGLVTVLRIWHNSKNPNEMGE